MKAFVQRYKKTGAMAGSIVALVLFAIGWDVSAAPRGRIMAHIDLARRQYKILGYGLPPAGADEYDRLLWERHGIRFERVAGCIVSHSLVAYADAYNAVSLAAIESKYGPGVLEKTFEDGQRTWAHTQARTRPSFDSTDFFFHFMPAARRDAACFRAFAPGVSMETIANQCGKPDEETGTDDWVFVYHLEKGSSIRIETPYLYKVAQIIYTDSSGKRAQLLSQHVD